MTARHIYRLALLVLAVPVLAPLSLRAQTANSSSTARARENRPSTTASLSGAAGFRAHSPSGLVGARNLISLGTDFSTRYDDNVSQSNTNRLADTGFLISPRLAVSREDGALALALSYQPTLLVYRRETAYNEQDHDLNFNGRYRATGRLSLGADTAVLYRSSLLDSGAPVPAFSPGSPGSAGVLNDTIVTPFANEFEDNSRIDLRYQVGARSALTLFTTYMLRSFGKRAASPVPLFGTEGKTAGLRYLYRTGPRSALVLTSAYETFHTGNGTRLGLGTASVGWTVALTRRLQVNVFGGPVHSRMQGSVLVPFSSLVTLSIPVDRSDWFWAAGGGITLATESYSLRLSGRRQVTDGGGLLDAVTNDVIEESFERRLGRAWSIRFLGGWQRNAAIATTAEPGALEGEYGGVSIRHRLSRLVTVTAGYEYQRQRTSGAVPLGASFDRNFVYVTLSYRFKHIPLGR